MADEDDDGEEVEEVPDEEDGEGVPASGGGKKKLILILLLVTFLLISLIFGGLYLFGILDPWLGVEESETDTTIAKGQFYYKLEEITVNLVASGKKSRFLKLGITVAVVQEADISAIETLAPRITDNLNQYLRELEPGEITGSANFYRMHENILLRVRAAVAPITVTDVLITSALVQ
ncbi:MAG: flagellar basal body protein FliL [Alphaproteobacteria bacterium]|jgi:flagellar protein FliL|nr:flagellar basal body protein FliL [Alphaproteobacteria bacterium]MBT7944064.1 flagellar basal body protein FliL [Alphaproteobacteria bacterium]